MTKCETCKFAERKSYEFSSENTYYVAFCSKDIDVNEIYEECNEYEEVEDERGR